MIEEESIIEYDWVRSDDEADRHIHHATFDDPTGFVDEGGGVGTTTCGRYSGWLMIPGMFTRIGALRCPACCKALGYPTGRGSPKNDNRCAKVLKTRLSVSTATSAPVEVALNTRYFLRRNGTDWVEVNKDTWVAAEREAGFNNTMGQPTEPATAGFSLDSTVKDLHIEGRVVYNFTKPSSYDNDPDFKKVAFPDN